MKIGDKVRYKGTDGRLVGKDGTVLRQKEDLILVKYGKNKEIWSCKDFVEVINNEEDNNPIIPDHYKQGNIDTIAFCESFFTKEQLRGAYRFNVIKYNHRYLDKNGLEDLKKAEFYLKKLIDLESSQ